LRSAELHDYAKQEKTAEQAGIEEVLPVLPQAYRAQRN
jgi:hypothetical protein